MKIIILVILSFALVGCNFGPGRTQTETVYQEVKVPVSNTPMPPNTDCPATRIETLSGDRIADDGEVAKAYRISIAQLRECSSLREAVINKYREIAKEDERNIDELRSQAGPVASAGPTANNAPMKSAGPPIVQFDDEETRRRIKQEQAFEEFENDFQKLYSKDYDIE